MSESVHFAPRFHRRPHRHRRHRHRRRPLPHLRPPLGYQHRQHRHHRHHLHHLHHRRLIANCKPGQ